MTDENTQEILKREQTTPNTTFGDIAAVLGAPPAVAGGTALAVGGYNANKVIPSFKVDPSIYKDFDRFSGVNKERDPGKLMRKYVDESHNLLQNDIDFNGQKMSAKDFVAKMRKGPIGKLLSDMGVQPKFDEGSMTHYDRFMESPQAGYRQLLVEHNMDPKQVNKGFMDAYKAQRWEALKEMAESGATDVDQKALAENLANRYIKSRGDVYRTGVGDFPVDDLTRAHVTSGAQETERLLERSNPERYRQHLKDTLEAIRSKDTGRLGAADSLKDQIFADSKLYDQSLDDIAARAHSGTPDFVTSNLNAELAPEYRKATGTGGYGSIGKGLKILRNAKRMAKGAVGVGALGAVAGLGFGVHQYNDYQKRKAALEGAYKGASVYKVAISEEFKRKALQGYADTNLGKGRLSVSGGAGTAPFDFTHAGDTRGTAISSGMADYLRHNKAKDSEVARATFRDAASDLRERKATIQTARAQARSQAQVDPATARKNAVYDALRKPGEASEEFWARANTENAADLAQEAARPKTPQVADPHLAERLKQEKAYNLNRMITDLEKAQKQVVDKGIVSEPDKTVATYVDDLKAQRKVPGSVSIVQQLKNVASKVPWKKVGIGAGVGAGVAGLGAGAHALLNNDSEKAASFESFIRLL